MSFVLISPSHQVAEPPKVGGTLAKLSSTPKSEIPLRSGSGLKKSSSSRFSETSAPWSLEKLPSFKGMISSWHHYLIAYTICTDIPGNLRTELLQRKLNQCCVLFDFTDPKSELKQKGIINEVLIVPLFPPLNNNNIITLIIITIFTVTLRTSPLSSIVQLHLLAI